MKEGRVERRGSVVIVALPLPRQRFLIIIFIFFVGTIDRRVRFWTVEATLLRMTLGRKTSGRFKMV